MHCSGVGDRRCGGAPVRQKVSLSNGIYPEINEETLKSPVIHLWVQRRCSDSMTSVAP